MAQTTTAASAIGVSVWLDNAGGTPTDISGSAASLRPSLELEQGMYRARASAWPKHLDGGKNASVTINVVFSTTADEGWDILKDWFHASSPGARTLTWYEPSKTAGADCYSGEFRLERMSWDDSAGAGGPVVATADLVPDGAVSHSTYSP